MVASAPSVTTEWPALVQGSPADLALAPPVAPVAESASVRRTPRRALLPWLLAGGDLGAAILVALVAPLADVVGLALAVPWVASLAVHRGYTTTSGDRLLLLRRVSRAALTVAFIGLVLIGAAGLPLGPGPLAAFVVVLATCAVVQRAGAGMLRARTATRVVVAGHRHGVERMLSELRAGGGFTVVGACLSGAAVPAELGVPVTHGLASVRSCVEQTGAEAVVVVPCRHLDPSRLRRLAWQLEAPGTPLLVATGLHDLGPTRAAIRHAGPVALIELRHARLAGPARVVKQLGERTAAALALLLVAPVLLVLAVAVRLESTGPALFRQTRVGRDGRTFTMLKLRTMCADAEERRVDLAERADTDGVLFKMRRDPRITRVGQLLRTYSLDELPQLVNVVRGEMSLVGPRPPLLSEVEQYDEDTRRRLAVTPGLTGLWQVSGRSDLSWEESVRLDLRYVENWSLGLDLHILARTVGAVLRHRGAY